MKGKTSSALILLSVVSASLAAVGIGRATVHESHPDQCYHEKSNSYFSPGESWQLDGCSQATCERFSRSSSQLMISYESCGVAMVAPPCYLVQDNTKPYPSCCNQVVCPESNDDELYAISSEEELNLHSNSSASEESPAASDNSLSGSAVHFSLGSPFRPFKYTNLEKNTNTINREERNELNSLEDEDNTDNDEESFEIIHPRMLPPTFRFATFDDDIDNDHEQRFNEVDAQRGDYQLV